MSSFNCQSFSKIDHDLRARRQFEYLSQPAKAIQLDGLSLLADRWHRFNMAAPIADYFRFVYTMILTDLSIK